MYDGASGQDLHKSNYGGKAGYKNRVIIEFFAKTASKINFLTVQGDFCKIIDVVQRKLCFLTL